MLKKNRKNKLILWTAITILLISAIPAKADTDYHQKQIISNELLSVLNVSYSDLLSGNFGYSDERTPCIIWIEDVDPEIYYRAGLDAANKTIRDNGDSYSSFYEVYKDGDYKDIIVEMSDDVDNLYVQTYIMSKRNCAEQLYEINNNKFVEENKEIFENSLMYVSKYSPCILAQLTICEIADLVASEAALALDFWNVGGIETETHDFNSTQLNDLNEAIALIRADEARSIYGVGGAGVKIGQIESSCPGYAAVTCNPSCPNTSINGVYDYHSDDVYYIMRQIAPSAQYYASGMYASNTTNIKDYNYMSQVEWLLGKGVNIINCSCAVYTYNGDPVTYNSYTAVARWMDHIAYNHDAHFVKSSGNSGASGVTVPAMSYNTIAVGQLTLNSGNPLSSGSSYCNSLPSISSGRTHKPDFVAPGQLGSVGGTSFSAPMVTGAIALLCDYQPVLLTRQHVVKALLAATTRKTVHCYTNSSTAFKKYGAGMIDTRSAIYNISQGNYTATGTVSSSSTVKTYSMNVTEGDTLMRVSLAYANRLKYTENEPHNTNLSGTIGELELRVYAPDGTQVASCTEAGANLKVLSFDPRGTGTGIYTIKVIQVTSASGGRVTNFGVAWR